ncbi:MAG: aspartate aminotransferase family protein [Gammaproteobacteria bacterium]|jgi:beta-alanine--pyruvate transaminase|uniref:aspartate aminotransferase family protein n=1 Tax=Marinomonas sp. ef1 TaxID=2005043 RepID=UPI000C287399|nr:aspartate aminotransferase family protein [Marinomonas sp. ef1]MBU1293376.1 aspartate aminotransferase family protein [Gammaproteobacteria bacterium]MBU1465853.1 aspartate aminotransferase family protein [Gammaproteobacteria bacterium]MBU2022574.1 aspartate aminotransferase family protein [Gammaproteobacteria bacterium]MBU2240630.1 aspartate aminotransferase family protein [Gammaproteobacteria bacterium]MBU2318195.1 aspartate aminotransferase family protein [Gammaproteobacteria bacterium]
MSHRLTQAQLDAHWMAYTGNRQFKKDPRIITSAAGKYYTDSDGRKIFDGLSGLWTCGLGHSVPAINEAVAQQVKTLDYSPAFQFGHEKSFLLAEQITEFMPAGLNRIFFTGSGSESVDTALKVARAYWRKKGMGTKTKFIGRAKGYHGAGISGFSVGGIPANRTLYGQGLESYHLPHTQVPGSEFSKGMAEQGKERADDLLNLIMMHDASNIAAVIVEPMSGSAGVIVPPQGYLQRLREICDQHNILLIFDEVITAFGRMGAKTGAEAFGVTPDVITMAKQVTNGVIPMGAVAFKQEIYDTFMDNGGAEYMLEIPHGYTYSAHPIACAAGLASLAEIKKQGLIERVSSMSPAWENSVHQLKDASSMITDIRNYGFAAGITIAPIDGEPAKRPFQIAMAMWDKGYYVRYGADTIQLAPPFTTEQSEIDSLINALGETIKQQS